VVGTKDSFDSTLSVAARGPQPDEPPGAAHEPGDRTKGGDRIAVTLASSRHDASRRPGFKRSGLVEVGPRYHSRFIFAASAHLLQ
jgi:hypothetical protein